MQLAIDFPAAVHSLSLLEPALVFKIAGSDKLSERLFPMNVKYQSGDKAGALEHFMDVIEGPGWRTAIDSVPGAWQMAIADADNFFQVEGLAMAEWGSSSESECTAEGKSSASCIAIAPPYECPTMCALSMPRWRIRAAQSAAWSAILTGGAECVLPP